MVIQNGQQFNILPAQPGLREYVRYYNVSFPEKDTFAAQYTHMPNACGTLSLAFDGSSIRAELWGATTVPVPLGTEPNRYNVLLLIQLSPFGLYQITRQNQRELTDRRLLLADLDSGLSKLLEGAFAESTNVAELVRACDGILDTRLEKHVVSDAVLSAAGVISDSYGQVRVREAARQSGYSERQLNRLFAAQIGMSVKRFARLARFAYVLRHIGNFPGFAALSQQAGYFDQAHFDKDFKAVSGVSPEKYMSDMSGFYYDGTEK